MGSRGGVRRVRFEEWCALGGTCSLISSSSAKQRGERGAGEFLPLSSASVQPVGPVIVW